MTSERLSGRFVDHEGDAHQDPSLYEDDTERDEAIKQDIEKGKEKSQEQINKDGLASMRKVLENIEKEKKNKKK